MEKRTAAGSASAFSLLFEVSVPHVLGRIFLDGDLNAADVANCRSVCKAWKAFIDAHILGRETNARNLSLSLSNLSRVPTDSVYYIN